MVSPKEPRFKWNMNESYRACMGIIVPNKAQGADACQYEVHCQRHNHRNYIRMQSSDQNPLTKLII